MEMLYLWRDGDKVTLGVMRGLGFCPMGLGFRPIIEFGDWSSFQKFAEMVNTLCHSEQTMLHIPTAFLTAFGEEGKVDE